MGSFPGEIAKEITSSVQLPCVQRSDFVEDRQYWFQDVIIHIIKRVFEIHSYLCPQIHQKVILELEVERFKDNRPGGRRELKVGCQEIDFKALVGDADSLLEWTNHVWATFVPSKSNMNRIGDRKNELENGQIVSKLHPEIAMIGIMRNDRWLRLLGAVKCWSGFKHEIHCAEGVLIVYFQKKPSSNRRC